jgi:hypothetical protein
MGDRVDPGGRIRGALAQRLVQVINENPWHTPDVAAEIGAEAIPILLEVETRDDVHPPPGIDVRDWLDMQTEGLARAGEANLDRFIIEVTARKAQDRLIVLWAIGMMREIPASRVAPILLEAMHAFVGYHRELEDVVIRVVPAVLARLVSTLSTVDTPSGRCLSSAMGGEWWQGSPISRIISKWPEPSTVRPLTFARSE